MFFTDHQVDDEFSHALRLQSDDDAAPIEELEDDDGLEDNDLEDEDDVEQEEGEEEVVDAEAV